MFVMVMVSNITEVSTSLTLYLKMHFNYPLILCIKDNFTHQFDFIKGAGGRPEMSGGYFPPVNEEEGS